MGFKKEKILNYYLHDTAVENVFISEYLADAPGGHVKVYLFALMHAGIGMDADNEAIAKQLSLTAEEVLSAWTWWEGKGIVKKRYKDPQDRFHYGIEFLNLKEQIYGSPGKHKKKDGIPPELAGMMDDQELKQTFSRIEQITGRLLEGKEPVAILSWINDYGISPDLAVYAYEYCAKNRKNSRHNYVNAVVKEWAEKGILTAAQAEKYLQENDSRHYLYKRVLKALGLSRNPTEEERRIMDTWFDDMNYEIDQVLTACKKTSGISNPNINYINSVLSAWSKEGKGGKPETSSKDSSPIGSVMKSYEEERAKREEEAEARRQEVYAAVPRVRQIEGELREIGMEIAKRMLSGGSAAKQAIRELREKTDRLNQEKAYLLTDNNFRLNHMDVWHSCAKCRDTGFLDTGERCPCFALKLDELSKKV